MSKELNAEVYLKVKKLVRLFDEAQAENQKLRNALQKISEYRSDNEDHYQNILMIKAIADDAISDLILAEQNKK